VNPVPTPFECEVIVKPEWIDPNGHMNIAYYVVAFDEGNDVLQNHLGLGYDDIRRTGNSAFIVGMNVDYRREVFEGDPLRIETRLLDWDHKRFHVFHEMYHAAEGFLAATNEVLFVHLSMRERRSVPFPDAVQTELARIAAAHERLGVPEGAFRTLGIRRK
jgi:acyl-CoA thioester hydrolase